MMRRVKAIEVHPPVGLTEPLMAMAVLKAYKKWRVIPGLNTLDLVESPSLVVVDFKDLVRIDLYHSRYNGPNEPVFKGPFLKTEGHDGTWINYEVVDDGCKIFMKT